MTWAVPRTHVAGEVTTAAIMNQYARDNFKALVPQSDRVDTSQTTASTTFADLATAGPTVTVDTYTRAHVFVSCQLMNNTANAWSMATAQVTGASTIAVDDFFALQILNENANQFYATTHAFTFPSPTIASPLPELTPGSNTFTMKYRVTAGTGTFVYRQLIVVPAGPGF